MPVFFSRRILVLLTAARQPFPMTARRSSAEREYAARGRDRRECPAKRRLGRRGDRLHERQRRLAGRDAATASCPLRALCRYRFSTPRAAALPPAASRTLSRMVDADADARAFRERGEALELARAHDFIRDQARRQCRPRPSPQPPTPSGSRRLPRRPRSGARRFPGHLWVLAWARTRTRPPTASASRLIFVSNASRSRINAGVSTSCNRIPGFRGCDHTVMVFSSCLKNK